MSSNRKVISTIVADSKALLDFKTLLFTLDLFHGDDQIDLYVLTNSIMVPNILKLKTSRRKKNVCNIHTLTTLDKYGSYDRKMMEARPGIVYDSQYKDFTMEKATAIECSLRESAGADGVWFLNANVCLTAPLPDPGDSEIALSPNYIREGDERLYGHYNAGFLWIARKNAENLIRLWRGATHGSRFFEQASLEDVAREAGSKQEFGIQDNFGWWRLVQSSDPPDIIRSRLGYKRDSKTSGITFDGVALRSLHTHWYEKTPFNDWIIKSLGVVARSHPEAKALLTHIQHIVAIGKV
jgi:hypothetical protein